MSRCQSKRMQLTGSSAGAYDDTKMSSYIKFVDIRAIILDIFRDTLLTLEGIQPHHVTTLYGTTEM